MRGVHPRMLPSGQQIELVHGDQRAVVVEVGGGLREYVVGGVPLLDGYADDEICPSSRGALLIPWPNRLRDGRYEWDGEELQLPLSEPARGNAIHGLVRWRNWRVRERERGRVVMEHVLFPREGYPFALALAVSYELDEGGLTVTTTAINAGADPCPFGVGAHPYLAARADSIDGCRLQAPGTVCLRTDERAIPIATLPVEGTDYDFRSPRRIGSTELDTCYSELERGPDGRAWVTLAAPDGSHPVAFWLDQGYRYLMLFTGDSLPDPARRRRGLGIEPMTCAPNAFQSGDGLRVLSPGEAFTASWGIEPG